MRIHHLQFVEFAVSIRICQIEDVSVSGLVSGEPATVALKNREIHHSANFNGCCLKTLPQIDREQAVLQFRDDLWRRSNVEQAESGKCVEIIRVVEFLQTACKREHSGCGHTAGNPGFSGRRECGA